MLRLVDDLTGALARFGAGLPANVIPIQVNEVTQIGLETLVATFAYGAAGLRFLLKAKPKHSPEGLQRNIAFAETILSGLGFGNGLASMIETDDPDALGQALTEGVRSTPLKAVSEFLPLGSGRGLLKLALEELRNVAPEKSALIPMPPRAPVGGLKIDAEGCTLCLACVGACPTGALLDNPERPMLRFSEDLCVQCGLCYCAHAERVSLGQCGFCRRCCRHFGDTHRRAAFHAQHDRGRGVHEKRIAPRCA